MRVWVTRSEPGASRLAAALRQAGHAPWTAPTLDIERLDAPLPAGHFTLTAFLSEHAVSAAFANGWAPGPAVAIGAATGAALRARGVVPALPTTATSEGLIALFAEAERAARRDGRPPCRETPAANLPGRILIATGEGGRDVLLAWLAGRGAQPVKWPVYRRVARRGALPSDIPIEAIVVASGAGLQAMADLWLPSGRSLATLVVAPSPRVADAARQLGFTHVRAAAGADAAATLAALRRTPAEEPS